MLDRVNAILSTCNTPNPVLVRTELYNEDWMLRLVMDWFSKAPYGNHPLAFAPGSRWFSEGSLPTHFTARYLGDKYAEGRTRADGLVGHFVVGQAGRNDVLLEPSATHFQVLEAKMFSPLSTGIKNAPYYDQASRTIASIAEILCWADHKPSDFARLGYFVLAPAEQLARPSLSDQLDKDNIRAKVDRRIREYSRTNNQWFQRWFLPTLEQMQVVGLSWEEVIDFIKRKDPAAARGLDSFYQNCLQHNRQSSSNKFNGQSQDR